MAVLGLYNYFIFAVLLMVGLYCVLARTNIIKSLIGLSIFQSAVFLLYISMDKIDGGTAPIIQEGVENQIFANPLPQVLILTAIVVGISTTALALAVTVRIKEAYGTIEEDKIQEMDREP
ncbi:MAG: cation:proton antiporter subunit C [Anderseniella sp.]